MDPADVAMIREAITGLSRQVTAGVRSTDAITCSFRLSANYAGRLSAGDRVLLRRVSDELAGGYRIYNLRGEELGLYSFSERTEKLWPLLAAPEFLDSVVESVETTHDVFRFRVQVTAF